METSNKQKFIFLFKKNFFSITFFQRKKKAMRGAAPHAAYFDQRQSRQNASLKRREGLEWVLKVDSYPSTAENISSC